MSSRRYAHRTGSDQQVREQAALRARLAEYEELLRAIQHGDLDALVIGGAEGERVYTLQGPDAPYRTLVETMNEGAVTLLPDGTVLYANQRLAELVALPLELVVGKPFRWLVVKRDQEPFDRLLQAGRSGVSTGLCRLQRSDGSEVSTQLSFRSLPDITVPAICMIITDVTAQEQAMVRMEGALREKEVLLKEIHHRVKNNLQVIASLLRLQSRTLPDATAHALFRETQHRIRAMALVHEQLYATGDLARIDAYTYLRDLTNGIMGTYVPVGSCIRLACVSDLISLEMDSAVPLGLIVTELVSNSIKYAFPTGKGGAISVELRASPSSLTLTVSDDGVGLPKGFDLHTNSSLGLQIVSSLVEQLEGTLMIDDAGGTTFRITMGTKG